jgi:hypothetical protein
MQIVPNTFEPPRLDLRSVIPLLEYLHGLPQDSIDRRLTFCEDKAACDILLELELDGASRELDELILYYIDPDFSKSRTLGVWYGIARSVAFAYQRRY